MFSTGEGGGESKRRARLLWCDVVMCRAVVLSARSQALSLLFLPTLLFSHGIVGKERDLQCLGAWRPRQGGGAKSSFITGRIWMPIPALPILILIPRLRSTGCCPCDSGPT